MKSDGLGESLAVRLFTMPLDQLLEALEAIEDLDKLVLTMLKENGDTEAIEEWRQKVLHRKVARQRFLEFRIEAELVSVPWIEVH